MDLASIGPLRLHLYQALKEHEPSIASVLVEVVAEPSTQENPGSSTFITGWPIRYQLLAAPNCWIASSKDLIFITLDLGHLLITCKAPSGVHAAECSGPPSVAQSSFV